MILRNLNPYRIPQSISRKLSRRTCGTFTFDVITAYCTAGSVPPMERILQLGDRDGVI